MPPQRLRSPAPSREIPRAAEAPRGFWDVFTFKGRVDWPVVVVAAILNLVVLINAIWHHPKIGYDVVENLSYIQVLTRRLPRATDTGEFFSPPLPFVLPALFDRVCEKFDTRHFEPFDDFYISWTCRTYDGKLEQALNVLLSIGTTIALLKLCQQIRPDSRFLKLSSLALLGNLTVYYKTFSQVRGEPWVVFFTLLSLYLVGLLLRASSFSWRPVIWVGISLGALILSRQWGFFIFPPLALLAAMLFVHDRSRGWLMARRFASSSMIGLLIGAFFYVHLYRDYGTATAFNIDRPVYPSTEKAIKLLRRTHLRNSELFGEPIRPAFRGSVFPILYSETFGDYWGYFTYIKPNSSYGVNGYSTSPEFIRYLGRVNLASIPVALMLAGGVALCLWELGALLLRRRVRDELLALVCLTALCMLLGFGWFIYSYVLQSELVLKASYALQGLVVLTLPAGMLLDRIGERAPVALYALLAVLAVVFLHNLPAMITHYNVFAFW